MARHHAFRMELKEDGPVPGGQCDVCVQGLEGPRYFQTFIETQMQSRLCVDCVKDGAKLMRDTRRIPASGPLSVS